MKEVTALSRKGLATQDVRSLGPLELLKLVPDRLPWCFLASCQWSYAKKIEGRARRGSSPTRLDAAALVAVAAAAPVHPLDVRDDDGARISRA